MVPPLRPAKLHRTAQQRLAQRLSEPPVGLLAGRGWVVSLALLLEAGRFPGAAASAAARTANASTPAEDHRILRTGSSVLLQGGDLAAVADVDVRPIASRQPCSC